MNFLFSLLFLFIFFPKGHRFEQENYDEREDVSNLSVEGTDGSELDKVYAAQFFQPTDAATESQNVANEDTVVPSLEREGSIENSELIRTSAPATALDVFEENLSSEHNSKLLRDEQYSLSSNFDSHSGKFEEGSKPKSSKVLKKSRILLAVDKETSKLPKGTKEERDIESNSVPSEKLKSDFKSSKKILGEEDEKTKFLLKNSKSGKTINAEQNVLNLQENSTAKPPYVLKHKMVNGKKEKELDSFYFLIITIGCSVAGIAGLALAGYCWYKLHTTAKAVSETDYPGSYGATARKQPLHAMQSGDSKLDYNAEMYHYQQTKNELAAMKKASGSRAIKGENLEDEENSDEGDEGDYTVYECPGLAPTGDMTVVNPMFSDQEQVTSDQDASGGGHSGRSAEGSPTFPRQKANE